MTHQPSEQYWTTDPSTGEWIEAWTPNIHETIPPPPAPLTPQEQWQRDRQLRWNQALLDQNLWTPGSTYEVGTEKEITPPGWGVYEVPGGTRTGYIPPEWQSPGSITQADWERYQRENTPPEPTSSLWGNLGMIPIIGPMITGAHELSEGDWFGIPHMIPVVNPLVRGLEGGTPESIALGTTAAVLQALAIEGGFPADVDSINWSPDAVMTQDQSFWPSDSAWLPTDSTINWPLHDPRSSPFSTDIQQWANDWGHSTEPIPLPFQPQDLTISDDEFWINWLAQYDPDTLIGQDMTGWNPDAVANLKEVWGAHGLDIPDNPVPWPSDATWPEGGLPGDGFNSPSIPPVLTTEVSPPTDGWWTSMRDRLSWPADPFRTPVITTDVSATQSDGPFLADTGHTTIFPTVTVGGNSWFFDPLYRPDIPILGETTIVPSPAALLGIGGLTLAGTMFADDISGALSNAFLPDMSQLRPPKLELPPPQRGLFNFSQPLLAQTAPASWNGNLHSPITTPGFATKPYIPLARRSPGLFGGRTDIGDLLLKWYKTGEPLITGIPFIDVVTAPDSDSGSSPLA